MPADFVFHTLAAEAPSRNLIVRDIHDRIALLRAAAGDGPMQARILVIVYLPGRIAGDGQIHGVHTTPRRQGSQSGHAIAPGTRRANRQGEPERSGEGGAGAGGRRRRNRHGHHGTAALPGRIESALQDAVVELEPKTQKLPIPRPKLTTLAELRATIASRLAAGPVRPTA